MSGGAGNGKRGIRSARPGRALARDDPGSGTVAGAALVAMAGILLTAIAVAGSLFVCGTRARSAADLAAVGAAEALSRGVGNPCAVAQTSATANGGRLERCAIEGMDVVVGVAMPTDVPFVPELLRMARAGPVACDRD
ncbi:flp pilus-assembly TadE/G-like family protein [Bifidobacterium pullorum subsp. saeculare]|uniref:Flp pilus-assembly TadE/G-like family protein n=1 Tax=Bifidobacterium pullorum subsp. saeculare TaxID=78257 RepID=A0A939B9G5_9BIFI|nr:Rv3654c family TadE-like protein [Bifidobacterium pullorum]MBM6699200.1 flp pilus-assembly TadE/G-like family protein [Bifidobacterium pullorum subsp. saeculare]